MELSRFFLYYRNDRALLKIKINSQHKGCNVSVINALALSLIICRTASFIFFFYTTSCQLLGIALVGIKTPGCVFRFRKVSLPLLPPLVFSSLPKNLLPIFYFTSTIPSSLVFFDSLSPHFSIPAFSVAPYGHENNRVNRVRQKYRMGLSLEFGRALRQAKNSEF